MSTSRDNKNEKGLLLIKLLAANIAIVGLFIGTTLGWLLPQGADIIMANKQEMLSEQTDIVWSLLDRQETRVRQGELSLESAQAKVALEIKELRYGPEMKDYFWINDLRPVMIMHPYRPDLVGQELASFTDFGGKAVFLEMVNKAAEEGDGFVEYHWERPEDPQSMAAKLSHVRLFRPWGWIIGTGVYLDDIESEMQAKRKTVIAVYIAVALAGILIVCLLGVHLARHNNQDTAADPLNQTTGLDQRKGGSIQLQTAILAIITPVIVAMSAVACFLVYRQLYDIIQAGFDRKLHAISSVVGCFINGDDHAALARLGDNGNDPEAILAAEETPLYQRYIVPMRRIMVNNEITYLYTQTLEQRPQCRYVLDATTGDEHTPIGYRDTLPIPDYLGAEKVLRHGIVYVGGIESTELWGLIKSAFAPIYNTDGTITAMAGADVNISVIKAKTRVAMFGVGLTGVIVVVIAGLLTMVQARRLTKPLAALKDGMLRMAAGHYEHRIAEQGPKEIRKLTAASNRIGTTMADRLSQMQIAYQEMKTHTRCRDLILTLDTLEPSDTWPGGTVTWLEAESMAKTASGWLYTDDRAFFWLAASNSSPLSCLRLRHDMKHIAQRLVAHVSGEDTELLATLASLAPSDIHSLFSFSPQSGQLWYLTRQPVEIAELTTERWRRRSVEGAGDLVIADPNHRMVLTDQAEILKNPLFAWIDKGMNVPPPEEITITAKQILIACLAGYRVSTDMDSSTKENRFNDLY